MNTISLQNSINLGSDKFKGIKPGWTIKVYQKIKEGSKTRVQAFEGTVIARKHGNEPGGTVTVRKMFGGYGVEKIFPIYLPTIEKVEVVRQTKTRRAKLYYLREKSAREIRKKMKTQQQQKQQEAEKPDQEQETSKE